MRKLKLDLNTLVVEGFDTKSRRDGVRGTVQGHGTIDCWPSALSDCADTASSCTLVDYLTCGGSNCTA